MGLWIDYLTHPSLHFHMYKKGENDADYVDLSWGLEVTAEKCQALGVLGGDSINSVS